jgi:hypothetical protein
MSKLLKFEQLYITLCQPVPNGTPRAMRPGADGFVPDGHFSG